MGNTEAPRASLAFAPADVDVERTDGGGLILRSPMALKPHAKSVGVYLNHWAAAAPERVFLAERADDGGWREVTYGAALQQVEGVARALLARGLGPDAMVMTLSDNGVDNGLLQLACQYVGIPVVPVSPAYSLLSRTHEKLRHIHALIRPALIYAADGRQFEAALDTLDLGEARVVVSRHPPERGGAELFEALPMAAPGPDVAAAHDAVGPDTVAKILFTSGSTGMPKGVINTHRMLCSNQQAIAQMWPFIEERPPVGVDWLPWNHTFGGNHNFNMMLSNGGSLYIDGGKPAPGLIERTVANLREISPTVYFNVPRGFDMLIPHLERDDALRDNFFRDLDTIFYAAAALPQTLWRRLEELSVAARGEKVVMTSAWGATETAPLATSVHFVIDRAGVIGLPAPGTALKMVPYGDKMELRVKGPNVTPGYFGRDDLTRAAFDADGYYKIGDAGKLADPEDATRGVVFDGRVAEDFKLNSGTWVSVGTLRVNVIAAGAPLIQDLVVCGHDRAEIGVLIFLNMAECAALTGLTVDTPAAEMAAHPAVRKALRRGIEDHNRDNPASSVRVARALVLTSPPSLDANEITDKGYINQMAVLQNRADRVAELFDGVGCI